MNETASTWIQPRFDFLEQVEEESGINVSACFQCRKCTNGCPLTFAMDHYPDQIIRLVLLGQEDAALESATIWVCSSCETCTTRCPNDIDIAGVMDHLKHKARERGLVDPRENHVYAFHEIFLRDIARRGRVYEAGLLNEYMLITGAWRGKLREGTLLDDLKMGWSLMRKHRLPFRPHGIEGVGEIKRFFKT